MNPTSDPHDGGIGGPGIWDQMPLVPPTTTPKEVDDSELIWSRPKPGQQLGEKEKKKKKKKEATTKRKRTKKRTVKRKTAGRSKKRR